MNGSQGFDVLVAFGKDAKKISEILSTYSTVRVDQIIAWKAYQPHRSFR